MDREDETSSLVEALVDTTHAMGLEVDSPEVLSTGANLVVHLAPSPVVARVATLTADMRGGAADYLRRERDLASALALRGTDVVPPTDMVNPGPHTARGRSFLLLAYRRLEPFDLESAHDAELVGRSLADLLWSMSELPADLCTTDVGQPWPEIERLVSTVRATTDTNSLLEIEAAVHVLRASEPADPLQLVHGDAHKNNVARGVAGPIWFDFEDANRRPLAWDLATLRRSWPAAGQAACEAMGIDPQSPSMRWHFELRELYALLWNLLYALRFEESQISAKERLTAWLARRGETRE